MRICLCFSHCAISNDSRVKQIIHTLCVTVYSSPQSKSFKMENPLCINGIFMFKFKRVSLLDIVVSSHIWKGKHPRLRKSYLHMPKRDGDMALPNFPIYYWAVHSRCTAYCAHHYVDMSCLVGVCASIPKVPPTATVSAETLHL